MKIICQHENEKAGFVVVQTEPQIRTLYDIYGYTKLAFPYLIYAIVYMKEAHRHEEDGRFIYPGITKLGLSVYFANKSTRSFQNQVWLPPMTGIRRMDQYGAVCTNHNYDGRQYMQLKDLILDITSLWWGTTHSVCPEWKQVNYQEVLQTNWHFQSQVVPHYPSNSVFESCNSFSTKIGKVIEYLTEHINDSKIERAYHNCIGDLYFDMVKLRTQDSLRETFWNQSVPVSKLKKNSPLIDIPLLKTETKLSLVY